MDLKYKNKYLKYKNKYLELKNKKQTGGLFEQQHNLIPGINKVGGNGIITFGFKSLEDPEFKQKFLDFKRRYELSKDDLCIYNGERQNLITDYITLDDDSLFMNKARYIKYLFNGDYILAFAIYIIENGNILYLLLLCSNNKLGKGSGKILLDNIYEEFVNTKDFIMKLEPANYESLLQYYLNWKKPTFGDKINYGERQVEKTSGNLFTFLNNLLYGERQVEETSGERQVEETYGYEESLGHLFYMKTGDISRIPRINFQTFQSINLFCDFFEIDKNSITGIQMDRLKDFFTEKLKNSKVSESYSEQINVRIKNLNIPFLKFYLKSDTYF